MWRGLMLNRARAALPARTSPGRRPRLPADRHAPRHRRRADGPGQLLPQAEMLIVTTPACAAQKVAVRAAIDGAARTTCGSRRGREHERVRRARRASATPCSARAGAPTSRPRPALRCSARIPIEAAVAAGGDEGVPVVPGSGPAAEAFRRLARSDRRGSRAARRHGGLLGPPRVGHGGGVPRRVVIAESPPVCGWSAVGRLGQATPAQDGPGRAGGSWRWGGSSPLSVRRCDSASTTRPSARPLDAPKPIGGPVGGNVSPRTITADIRRP